MRIIKINENEMISVLSYITLLLFITVCVCLFLNINISIGCDNKQTNVEKKIQENLTTEINPIVKSNKLKQIMYIFHKLCDEQQIYYVIAYGTLLGAVRHWGMIPWDDDIDVIVKSLDRKKIYKILETIKNDYGFNVVNYNKISRIIVQDENSYCLDIFYVMDVNGKIYRTYTNDFDKQLDVYKEEYIPNVKGNEWWWREYDYNVDLLEKRKKFVYDDLLLWGPEKANELLVYWFGDNYLTTCKTHYLKNHNEYVVPEEKSCGDLPIPQL